jgi:hypothetical protein
MTAVAVLLLLRRLQLERNRLNEECGWVVWRLRLFGHGWFWTDPSRHDSTFSAEQTFESISKLYITAYMPLSKHIPTRYSVYLRHGRIYILFELEAHLPSKDINNGVGVSILML